MSFGDDKRERAREGFLGWGENDRSKGEEIIKKCQSAGKKMTFSVPYWLSCFFWELHLNQFPLYILPWPNLLCCSVFPSHDHTVALFLHFPESRWYISYHHNNTGLPTLAKQLAQFHNANSRHRGLLSPDNAIRGGSKNPQDIRRCSDCRRKSWVASAHEVTDSRDKLCFLWDDDLVGDGCLRQHCGSETIKVGEKAFIPGSTCLSQSSRSC